MPACTARRAPAAARPLCTTVVLMIALRLTCAPSATTPPTPCTHPRCFPTCLTIAQGPGSLPQRSLHPWNQVQKAVCCLLPCTASPSLTRPSPSTFPFSHYYGTRTPPYATALAPLSATLRYIPYCQPRGRHAAPPNCTSSGHLCSTARGTAPPGSACHVPRRHVPRRHAAAPPRATCHAAKLPRAIWHAPPPPCHAPGPPMP